MTYKTFKQWRTIIVIIAAALVGWAVASGNALVPVPVVICGIVIVFLFKKGVREVIVDERIFSIADKAAMLAYRIFAIIAATAGATLLALSREASPALEPAGITLAYSAAALVLIYFIAYTYYSRKFGGME